MFTVSILAHVALTTNPAHAQSCSPRQKTIATQQTQLGGLPPEMIAILRTLQDQRRGYCTRLGAIVPVRGIVDPHSPVIPTQEPQLPNGNHIPDQVVATITGNTDILDQIAQQYALTIVNERDSLLLNALIVTFAIPNGRAVSDVLNTLANDERIDTIAPQHTFDLQAEDVEKARYAPTKIALNTIDRDVTGQNIKIAVIDTAVDATHPSLKGAITDTFNALPDIPVTTRKHGTAIAGLIAGRQNVRGVAPAASLLIARAFDNSGDSHASATTTALISALDWAVEQGAQIINMSFAGPRNALLSKTLGAASERGIVLIAAAGNHGPSAPAAYPAAEPSVIAVTATDAGDRIYANANTGAYVFIAAPGVDVLVPTPGKGLDVVRGTSFAGAIVSGIAALMLQSSPGMSPAVFATQLESAAQDLGQPGRDAIFGAGLANAAKALDDK